jgi:pimeloyl-ACP methyl ester carboxylesterase
MDCLSRTKKVHQLFRRTLALIFAGTSWTSIFQATVLSQVPAEWVDDPLSTANVSESVIEQSSDEDVMDSRWNLPLPTLGGKQFWTDHRWWYGWRVQYNKTSDSWRLLDPSSVRRAWGTKEAMLAELAKLQADNEKPHAEPIDVVVLLHGLMRSASSMKPIQAAIDARYATIDATHKESKANEVPSVVMFAYSSTRESITSHAEALREVVEHLPGRPRLRFVGHSLGNIVLRTAISQWRSQGDPTFALDRMERVVMLGPPNQGSSFAKTLGQLGLFETITGHSGMQLGPSWNEFAESLDKPPCPFAVIAGDLSPLRIRNPFLKGPSDGVVTIEEAKLEGMDEFFTVPVLHSFLMRDSTCVQTTVDYLFEDDAGNGHTATDPDAKP